jgi:hypothetical protein
MHLPSCPNRLHCYFYVANVHVYREYPEARLPDPSTGGRIHIIGTALSTVSSVALCVATMNGVDVDVSTNSTQPPADWALDWFRIEPQAVLNTGDPIWVSFHSRQAIWDQQNVASLSISCPGGANLLNGTFPVAVPWVALTWLTSYTDIITGSASVHVFLKHQNTSVAPQVANQVLINGVDVTSAIPPDQLTVPIGAAAFWSIPASLLQIKGMPAPTTPGSVWTAEVHWEDAVSPVTAAGGMFWAEFYPIETWTGGNECPFPGGNTSNYDAHRSHGISTFFMDHDPNTEKGPGCASAPTAVEIINTVAAKV